MSETNEKPVAFQQSIPKPLFISLTKEANEKGISIQALIRFILLDRQKQF
jgi:hypothetical protein